MRRRKIEAHRLTISGLREDADYANFLVALRRAAHSHEDATQQTRNKSHLLWDARRQRNGHIRLSLISFSRGFRPDILDTDAYQITATPLGENQTGVEWTHCLGGQVGNRFVLLIEKHQGGIYPKSLEHYLNWLIQRIETVPFAVTGDEDQTDVVVSIEAEPGEEFIRRLDALDRITAATYRIVRPNPGWADLENELGVEAQNSNAQRAEVSMRPRRQGALSQTSGIIGAIKSRFRSQQLDFAHVEGTRDGRKDSFNTEHLGKHEYAELRTDEQGQVDHNDAWQQMKDVFDELV